MPFRPEPKGLSLPDKGFIPKDLVEEDDMDICEDCSCPITCQSFKHCIYQEA